VFTRPLAKSTTYGQAAREYAREGKWVLLCESDGSRMFLVQSGRDSFR
jgi:hypothetical protein